MPAAPGAPPPARARRRLPAARGRRGGRSRKRPRARSPTTSSSPKASATTTTGGRPCSAASSSTRFGGSDVASAQAITISAAGREPLELGLAGGQEHRGLVAGLLEIRRPSGAPRRARRRRPRPSAACPFSMPPLARSRAYPWPADHRFRIIRPPQALGISRKCPRDRLRACPKPRTILPPCSSRRYKPKSDELQRRGRLREPPQEAARRGLELGVLAAHRLDDTLRAGASERAADPSRARPARESARSTAHPPTSPRVWRARLEAWT